VSDLSQLLQERADTLSHTVTHTSQSYLTFEERRFRVTAGGLWLKIDGQVHRSTLAAHGSNFMKQYMPLKCLFPLFSVAPVYFLREDLW